VRLATAPLVTSLVLTVAYVRRTVTYAKTRNARPVIASTKPRRAPNVFLTQVTPRTAVATPTTTSYSTRRLAKPVTIAVLNAGHLSSTIVRSVEVGSICFQGPRFACRRVLQGLRPMKRLEHVIRRQMSCFVWCLIIWGSSGAIATTQQQQQLPQTSKMPIQHRSIYAGYTLTDKTTSYH
jgi:hypothetical protein